MKPLVLLLEGKQVISVCKVTLCFPSYTCSFIKIFRMTIKMAKHPITMTIMRMTSTPGTVRLCCCCYCYNFFFVFICFVCFFFQFILNSFLIPVEQITASNLRVLSPNWFVNSFAYFCLFVRKQWYEHSGRHRRTTIFTKRLLYLRSYCVSGQWGRSRLCRRHFELLKRCQWKRVYL